MRSRDARSLQRQAGTRSLPLVLIVCKGKTEQAYFSALRQHLRLSSAHVIIPKDPKGTSPKNLVLFASRRCQEDGGYDRIYCVFDRDRHPTFSTARKAIVQLQTSKPPIPIREVISNPCFEVWVMHHFALRLTSYGSPKRVLQTVRQHLPRYIKNDPALFSKVDAHRSAAKQHSALLAKHQKGNPERDPYTGIHEVVDFLEEMHCLSTPHKRPHKTIQDLEEDL